MNIGDGFGTATQPPQKSVNLYRAVAASAGISRELFAFFR